MNTIKMRVIQIRKLYPNIKQNRYFVITGISILFIYFICFHKGIGKSKLEKEGDFTDHKESRFIEDLVQHLANSLNFLEQYSKYTDYETDTSAENANRKLLIIEDNLISEPLPKAIPLKEPVLGVPKEKWIKYNQTWMGYSLPLVVIGRPAGRLGNLMASYASLIGISNAYDIPVLMSRDVRKDLSPIFPHLQMYVIPGLVGVAWQHISPSNENKANFIALEELAAGLKGPKRGLIEDFPCEMQLFNAYRDEVLREFTFNRLLISLATRYLHSISENVKNPNFVAIHVRRSDYIKTMKRAYKTELPDKEYILQAMDFYRKRLPNVLFVASSDDKDYLWENFGEIDNVHITDMVYEQDEDLAILASCNHTIMTVGSYGFWAGYLAGGTVLYPEMNVTISGGYYFTEKYFKKAGLNQFIKVNSTGFTSI